MSILFLILKIIGILILIPIVLLLILLIFPICYQIEGDFDGKSPKAQVKVSWAVIFLRAKAFYEEELNFGIRIFGIPIYDSRKEHWSVFGEHKKKDKKKHKKRSDSKKKQKNKKLIMIGRIDNNSKRFDLAIKAMKKLPEYTLDIYGDIYIDRKRDYEVLKELIKKENINNVTFKGATNKVQEVLDESGIYIMTSDYEAY